MSLASAPSSLIFRPASVVERLDLQNLFPRNQPLEVELGSGDGSFLAQYARLHPETNFLGVERLLGRLRKLDRKGLRHQLNNLRLLRLEASYVVAYLLPHDSVRALHIYFPDPWPKRRHRKHRLINAVFAASVLKTIEPRGVVYLRTDDGDYFQQMKLVFGEQPGFEPATTPEELAAITTDFERTFNAGGIPTLRAAYRKVG